MSTPGFESHSTWFQPMPAPASRERTELVDGLALRITGLSPGRLRVVIDGYTAAGKTSFGHELAAALRRLGRPTLRASLDDFKNPWSEAHLYDRLSGEGYYRNAWDFRSIRELLLEPAGPHGSGQVALCSIDPLTQRSHKHEKVDAPDNAVLIVDGVFAMRPELDASWDVRIWLDVDPALSLERGVARDTEREGRAEAEALHRDRYHAAEAIYAGEVDPVGKADFVIDNRDFANPRGLRGM
jgi:uridine kinase